MDNSDKELRSREVEHEMDSLIGYILLIGVLASIVLITTGVIWNFIDTGYLGLKYSIAGMNLFQFAAVELRHAGELKLRPELFVNLGFVTLLLTPYVRVAASMFFFAFTEKNLKYTCFTAIVFCILTYSLFLR
ncbi:MAG TPA: DUF1634 domain-containing protein [Candidatus Kryptonia bacterium]